MGVSSTNEHTDKLQVLDLRAAPSQADQILFFCDSEVGNVDYEIGNVLFTWAG